MAPKPNPSPASHSAHAPANPDTATPTGRNKPAQGKERSAAALSHASQNSPAPTGRNMPAQSDALGNTSQNTPSPEGAKEGGELPKGWSWKSLADVAADGVPILYGILQPGPDTPGGVPYVRPTEIVEDVIDLSSIRRTTPAIAAKYKRSVLNPDDVILSIVGTIGKVAVVPLDLDGGNITQSSVRVRPRSEVVSPRYVAWVLRSPVLRRQFDKHRLGTAVPRLNVAHVRALRVPIPPLPEQRRIVAEIEKQFTRLEAGVAALRRVQANLKRYRAAVLKAACEGRLVPTEAAWKQTTLGEVSTVLAGYGFPERLQGRSAGDIGFFKVGDISGAWKRNEKILTQANHYISTADLAELRAKVLPTGTVVFAKIGAAIALNRRAIIGEPSLVDNNVMGLLAGERIHPRFLFHFLCTQKLDELARATTVPSIRKGDVEGIKLKLPPLAEQTRIVAEVERRLSVVEELESVVTANLQRATRLRQSILQKAFSGRL
jgi:type I restriction enzyme, S subunit